MHENAGLRFSQNYIERGTALMDSARARRRIYRLFMECRDERASYADLLERETGTNVPSWSYGYDWGKFFSEADLRDVLDAVTVFAPSLLQYYKGRSWLTEVSRIFREENLAYVVDDSGGVHLCVDAEFNHNWSSTLAGLGIPRYEAARRAFEAAQRAMDGETPHTKIAVKQAFEAVETVFRLMLGSRVSRLGASEVRREFRNHIASMYSGTVSDSVSRLVESMAEWVNACHPYRHGQGVEEPDDPPLDVAVLALSNGAGYLRWLIELDQCTEAP